MMKLQKAISIIKKSTSINLWKDDSGRYLLSNGVAAYDVSGFPYIESESELAAVLGIDKVDDHVFSITDIPKIIKDCMIGERQAAVPQAITICFDGTEFALLEAGGTLYPVDSKYLRPFGDDDLFYFKPIAGGAGVFLVGGLDISGYIMPAPISDTVYSEIKNISNRGLWRNIK